MVETMGVVDDLVARVVALSANTDGRVLIGIAGAPGSGKTTLAQVLTSRLGGFPAVAHVPMDGFHLADVELARLGRADRKGAPDTFDVDGYARAARSHRRRRGGLGAGLRADARAADRPGDRRARSRRAS